MTEGLEFGGLLVVTLIALGAPLLAAVLPVRIPAVVLEIVAGIAVGPALLGWVDVDTPIRVLALVGLAFLLFLAGLEIDLTQLRGDLLRLPAIGFAVSLGLGSAIGAGFGALDWVRDPFFLAVVLSATSLGLIVPVLKDAGQATLPLGQFAIAGATIADFGAVILLTLLFSESEGSTTSKVTAVGLFLVVVAAVAVTLVRAGRSLRLDALLVRLQDTTAEIRVRVAVALLVGFVALAATVGLELILGAFIAGAVLGLADRDAMSHPHFRTKLDAIGYGFLIPVFFVTSGLTFDLDAITANPSAIARIPLFLLALVVVRGVPALLYRRVVPSGGTTTVALLQATSLPFIVTASEIGVSIGAIAPVTSAGLVSAGLLSVVLFPPVALARLRVQESVGVPPSTPSAPDAPGTRPVRTG